MTPDQVIQAFRAELKEIIPNIISELIWTREEATEEHYQLLICNILEEVCDFRCDIKAVFDWLRIPDDFFIDNAINEESNYKNFFRVFKNKGGGLVILRVLLNHLESLDVELTETPDVAENVDFELESRMS